MAIPAAPLPHIEAAPEAQKLVFSEAVPATGSPKGAVAEASGPHGQGQVQSSDRGESEEPARISRENLPSPWTYPQSALAVAALRALMVAQSGRALFARPAANEADSNISSYRATAFWPSKPGGRAMIPFVRCRYGEAEQECRSGLTFEKGELFAGRSWAKLDDVPGSVGGFVVKEKLENVEDLDDDVKAWRAHWFALGVPERIVKAMGGNTGYTKHVRSVASIGTKTPYGDMVFCIESVRTHAFQSEFLTEDAAKGSFEARLRSILLATVVDHVDFYTWMKGKKLQRAAVFTALLSLLSFIPNAAKLLPEGTAQTLQSLGTFLLQNALSVSHGATLVCLVFAFAFGLVADEHSISVNASTLVRERLSVFTRNWVGAWGRTIGSIALLFVVSLLRGKSEQDASFRALLSAGAIGLQVAAAHSVLAAYFAIDRFTREPGQQAPMNVHPAAQGVVAAIATTSIALVLLQVAYSHPLLVPIAHCLSSVLTSLSLCLLVGRLDSRLIGASGKVIALLYAGALAHAACGLARPGVVEWIHFLRLPLDMLLLIVVLWSIEGRALERYLTHVAEVAGMVPRQPARR